MKKIILYILLLCLSENIFAQKNVNEESQRLSSVISKLKKENLISSNPIIKINFGFTLEAHNNSLDLQKFDGKTCNISYNSGDNNNQLFIFFHELSHCELYFIPNKIHFHSNPEYEILNDLIFQDFSYAGKIGTFYSENFSDGYAALLLLKYTNYSSQSLLVINEMILKREFDQKLATPFRIDTHKTSGILKKILDLKSIKFLQSNNNETNKQFIKLMAAHETINEIQKMNQINILDELLNVDNIHKYVDSEITALINQLALLKKSKQIDVLEIHEFLNENNSIYRRIAINFIEFYFLNKFYIQTSGQINKIFFLSDLDRDYFLNKDKKLNIFIINYLTQNLDYKKVEVLKGKLNHR